MNLNQPRVFPVAKALVLDRQRTERLIEKLAAKIKRHGAPVDRIIATHDPDDVQGGYQVAAQLFRLLSKKLRVQPPIGRITVKGRRGCPRTVTALPKLSADVKRVLLVGDASFSGNTRKLTKAALQKRYPALDILTATATATTGRDQPDFSALKVTERVVQFPWGRIDSTGEVAIPLELESFPEHSVKFGYRVWGNYEEFALNTSCTARVLTVLPGQKLSLQVHFRRDELFLVLDPDTQFEYVNVYEGARKLTIDDVKDLVKRTRDGGRVIRRGGNQKFHVVRRHPDVGEYVLIPRGTLHRLIAPKGMIRVLEISLGFYSQDSDIARLEDDYGRVGLSGRF